MSARLVSLDGYPNIPLVAVLTVFGRDRECDARIASSRVSRRHCCVALGHDSLVVRDLSSANGTSINGSRVADGLMRPGDELWIAHLRYRFEIDGVATPEGTSIPPAGSSRETVFDMP